MKFGLLSQLQVPKPWAEGAERNVYWQNLDHVAAAEDSGFSHFWLTEQHHRDRRREGDSAVRRLM